MKIKINKSSTVFLILTVLYILVQLLFLTKLPDIMIDEPWYANTAFNFATGNSFTNTNVGNYGGDFFIVYTFLLGIGIKLLGCTLYATKMISVIGGIVALWALIAILKYVGISKLFSIITLLMFIFSNVTYIAYRTVRPEAWEWAFGLWAIYFLIKFMDQHQLKAILFSCLFATLSFLSHPNGGFFLMASGIYLIVYSFEKRSISSLVYFSLLSLLIIIIHFAVVFSNPNFHVSDFLFQVAKRNAVTNNTFSLADNVTAFYQTYSLGIKRLYILIFEVGILIAGLFYSKKSILIKYLSIFGLLNLILSLTLLSNYTTRHFGDVVIYSLVMFALISKFVPIKKPSLIYLGIGLVYLMNNFAGDLYLMYQKFNNTSYAFIEKQLSEAIPENSVVISSLYFWYPFKNSDLYSDYTVWEKTPYEDVNHLLHMNEVDYIVLTDKFLEGKTGTSGRSISIPTDIVEFFVTVFSYTNSNGLLVNQIPTVGYDTINVYQVKQHP